MSLSVKRANLSRKGGTWSDDDYDVLADGKVVGRIFHAGAGAPADAPWFWGIEFHHRNPHSAPGKQGHVASRDDAMAAFRAAWDAQGGLPEG